MTNMDVAEEKTKFDDVTDATRSSIARIREMEASWTRSLPKTPLPEFGVKLSVEDIKDNRPRLVKRIHQACSMHLEHFRATNAAKVAYLLRGYLCMVDTRNIYGLYYFSRAMLELLAFLHEVRSRVVAVATKAESNFIGNGQEFFSIVVRARYATSNPDLSTKLKAAGLSSESAKPFNITNCMKGLAASDIYSALAVRYDELCDFVHHNAPSHAAGSVGIIEAAGVVNSAGGAILTSKAGPIAIYDFPVLTKEADALNATVPLFLSFAEAVAVLQNSFPEGPYPVAFLVRETGNRFGMQVGHNPSQPWSFATLTDGYQPRYNDLCPCGSTAKYKQCCLNKRHIGATNLL